MYGFVTTDVAPSFVHNINWNSVRPPGSTVLRKVAWDQNFLGLVTLLNHTLKQNR